MLFALRIRKQFDHRPHLFQSIQEPVVVEVTRVIGSTEAVEILDTLFLGILRKLFAHPFIHNFVDKVLITLSISRAVVQALPPATERLTITRDQGE